jgi:hypothetical protein
MRRRFVAAQRLHETASLIRSLACQTDVYVGVALRNSDTHGGKNAINGSRLLYIDRDKPDTGERIRRFAYSPSMIVASGSHEHLHLYWSLREHANRIEVEDANRRLALALGGDMACVDIARVLRPPATMNHKHDPPVAVTLLAHDNTARYTLTELMSALPENQQPDRSLRARPDLSRTKRSLVDRELLSIPAGEYVRVLTGREPNRAGKVLCPFHTERNPSLQIYNDGTFYCFGSGCEKGGTIIDFAGYLWGLIPRGEQFTEIRTRLAVHFGLDRARCS